MSVTILDIIPEKQGVCRICNGEGQLFDKVKTPYARFFSVIDGLITMNEHIKFPSCPMIGVIGLAPEGNFTNNFFI